MVTSRCAHSAPTAGPPVDTVVVAGGRSSRLGGTPKAQLPVAGGTLLSRTVAAALPLGTVVVVGPEDPTLPPEVLAAREDPPFSGPAAAVAAGVVALRDLPGRAPWTAVLACDMPRVDRALPVLLAGAGRAASDVDGVMALSREGRRENLAVVVRTAALERVLARVPTADASVRSVWRHLRWDEVTVPGGSTADVDTWEDVHRLELD